MSDRDLLEKAAKAAGIEAHYPFGKGEIYVRYDGPWAFRDTSDNDGALKVWNPIADDSDALRLALSLNIQIVPDKAMKRSEAHYGGTWDEPLVVFVDWGDDLYAATRRAIVMAAAAMGEKT